jgi:hypothetical protein
MGDSIMMLGSSTKHKEKERTEHTNKTGNKENKGN